MACPSSELPGHQEAAAVTGPALSESPDGGPVNKDDEAGEGGARLADLLDRLARVARGLQFDADLNPAQWEALRFLGRANRQSRTPSGLAAYRCVTKGTASQTLKSLTEKGYVASQRSPDDGRVRDLAVSTTGQDLLSRDPLMTLARAARALDPACCRAVTETLGGLLQDVQQAQGWETFGVCTQCDHFRRGGGDAGAVLQDGGKRHRCGLTGEGLGTRDIDRLCINFRG